MIEWTDRHCRRLLRRFHPTALLYTEMITERALLDGDTARHLGYDPAEHPLAIQLGGSDPQALAACAKLAEKWGYAEVNLNVGCPSARVQKGAFGACLMREPGLVADCVRAMRDAIDLPVTVKTRIGVDDDDSEAFLLHFVATVADAGCDGLILHARKAFLKGLSPAQNRNVPPLNYARAHLLKSKFPALPVVLNGGVTDLAGYTRDGDGLDGVMIGRAAYHNPPLLAQIAVADGELREQPDRFEVFDAHLPYVAEQLDAGVRLHSMSRHMLSIFNGLPGARAYRRALSELPRIPGAGIAELSAAVEPLRARHAA